jgi:hypothetical protein
MKQREWFSLFQINESSRLLGLTTFGLLGIVSLCLILFFAHWAAGLVSISVLIPILLKVSKESSKGNPNYIDSIQSDYLQDRYFEDTNGLFNQLKSNDHNA